MLTKAVVQQLQRAVGRGNVVWDANLLRIWERDGSFARGMPEAVVLPGGVDEIAAVARIAGHHGIPLIPRGAGTGLSGGAVAIHGGIALQTMRMRRILELDPWGRTALVEPGVANADLNAAVSKHGLFFAPDPSSSRTCTIGGNVAENAGGPRSFAFGTTSCHVLEMEVVLPDGSLHWVGGEAPVVTGLDLLTILLGSEGTLATISKIRVRLVPVPEAVTSLAATFDSVAAANSAVSAILRSGIVPTALELMDAITVRAVEARFPIGYGDRARAALLLELQGLEVGNDELLAELQVLLSGQGAQSLILPGDSEEQELLWEGRRRAIYALAEVEPNFYIHDGVVPRSRLADVIDSVDEIGREYRVTVATVAHAGEGNLHPTFLYDALVPGSLEAVIHAGDEIVKTYISAGGTPAGEHGLGSEKSGYLEWALEAREIAALASVKDAFDPTGFMNPGKILPRGGELPCFPPARVGLTSEASWW